MKPVFLAAAFLLLLCGCSTFVSADQPSGGAPEQLTLAPGQSIGQTFTAHHAGLSSVDVFMAQASPAAGQLALRLQPLGGAPILTASLPAETIGGPDYYRFAFPAQADSRERDYHLTLTLSGTGLLSIGSAPGAAYLNGALYREGQPADAQLTFRTGYQPAAMAAGFAGQALFWLRLALAALFLFVAPGWALLAWLWPGWRALSWGERLGLAAGVSLALYPLLLLWARLAGLNLGPALAWAPGLLGLAALAWRAWRIRANLRAELGDALRAVVRADSLALAGVLALVAATRFLAVGALDAPMWGDSYHHTVITQLIVDHGGLFDSWQPYGEMQSFTYHFGFHAAAAALQWITGLGAAQAVLWGGQIVNILAVLALVPLAVKVSGGNRWAGVFAVLIAGLLSALPMSYANWGRYTQLAGQAILPAAMWLIWGLVEMEAPPGAGRLAGVLRGAAVAVLAMAGLALAHYRVLILAILGCAALLAVSSSRRKLADGLARIGAVGVASGLLFLPWFLHTFSGRITAMFGRQLATPAAAVSEYSRAYNSAGDLADYLPVVLWLLLAVAIGIGLWRRQRGVAWMGLWWGLAVLAANPGWLQLPGEGAINNFAVLIVAYLPAGVLIGNLAAAPARLLDSRFWSIAPAAVVLLIGVWGAGQRAGDLRIAQHALVTRADARAAAWIRDRLPPDARFLVNAFFAYDNALAVGSDAGWWLPLLAGRQTTLPPMNYGSEQEPRPGYIQWVNGPARLAQSSGIGAPDTLALLKERGVTHVYIGQQQGRVGYDGPHALSPDQLLADPHFVPVYHQDRVWIFEVAP
jgi:hypothetical protein